MMPAGGMSLAARLCWLSFRKSVKSGTEIEHRLSSASVVRVTSKPINVGSEEAAEERIVIMV